MGFLSVLRLRSDFSVGHVCGLNAMRGQVSRAKKLFDRLMSGRANASYPAENSRRQFEGLQGN